MALTINNGVVQVDRRRSFPKHRFLSEAVLHSVRFNQTGTTAPLVINPLNTAESFRIACWRDSWNINDLNLQRGRHGGFLYRTLNGIRTAMGININVNESFQMVISSLNTCWERFLNRYIMIVLNHNHLTYVLPIIFIVNENQILIQDIENQETQLDETAIENTNEFETQDSLVGAIENLNLLENETSIPVQKRTRNYFEQESESDGYITDNSYDTVSSKRSRSSDSEINLDIEIEFLEHLDQNEVMILNTITSNTADILPIVHEPIEVINLNVNDFIADLDSFEFEGIDDIIAGTDERDESSDWLK